MLFQTPLKLDAVKALRKEPVVETKTPFDRESKQASHLYVTLLSVNELTLLLIIWCLTDDFYDKLFLLSSYIQYDTYDECINACLNMYGISYRLRHQSRSQQPTALQRMASSSGRGLLEQVAGITGLTSKLKKWVHVSIISSLYVRKICVIL